MKVGNGWTIQYNPVARSSKGVNWEVFHEEHPNHDGLSFNVGSRTQALETIKDVESDHPFFNLEGT